MTKRSQRPVVKQAAAEGVEHLHMAFIRLRRDRAALLEAAQAAEAWLSNLVQTDNTVIIDGFVELGQQLQTAIKQATGEQE